MQLHASRVMRVGNCARKTSALSPSACPAAAHACISARVWTRYTLTDLPGTPFSARSVIRRVGVVGTLSSAVAAPWSGGLDEELGSRLRMASPGSTRRGGERAERMVLGCTDHSILNEELRTSTGQETAHPSRCSPPVRPGVQKATLW